jgi:hypothetical protein
MAETNEQRIAQLESVVNELTARVAAEPADVDLPPLLAVAKTELADLEAQIAEQAAAEQAAAEQAVADKAAAEKAAAEQAAAEQAAAEQAAAAKAKPAFFRKAAPKAPAAAPPKLAIKPLPPTVPASMRASRPNPAARRPVPVAGSSRSGK